MPFGKATMIVNADKGQHTTANSENARQGFDAMQSWNSDTRGTGHNMGHEVSQVKSCIDRVSQAMSSIDENSDHCNKCQQPKVIGYDGLCDDCSYNKRKNKALRKKSGNWLEDQLAVGKTAKAVTEENKARVKTKTRQSR